MVKSEESSVGGQSAASATLPPGVRRPDSYTFRVVSETDMVAHLMVRNRVGRVPDLMRFALCRMISTEERSLRHHVCGWRVGVRFC